MSTHHTLGLTNQSIVHIPSNQWANLKYKRDKTVLCKNASYNASYRMAFFTTEANPVGAKGWKWVSLILYLKLLATLRHSQGIMRPLPKKTEQKRALKKSNDSPPVPSFLGLGICVGIV